MHPTYDAIHFRAHVLQVFGMKQSAAELADSLRKLGMTAPSTGAPYSPGRGIHNGIEAAYRAVLQAHGPVEAARIVESFPDWRARLAYA